MSVEQEPRGSVLSERDRLDGWRLLELIRAYRTQKSPLEYDDIELLAQIARATSDLHDACGALARGCRLELAVISILDPAAGSGERTKTNGHPHKGVAVFVVSPWRGEDQFSAGRSPAPPDRVSDDLSPQEDEHHGKQNLRGSLIVSGHRRFAS